MLFQEYNTNITMLFPIEDLFPTFWPRRVVHGTTPLWLKIDGQLGAQLKSPAKGLAQMSRSNNPWSLRSKYVARNLSY